MIIAWYYYIILVNMVTSVLIYSYKWINIDGTDEHLMKKCQALIRKARILKVGIGEWALQVVKNLSILNTKFLFFAMAFTNEV